MIIILYCKFLWRPPFLFFDNLLTHVLSHWPLAWPIDWISCWCWCYTFRINLADSEPDEEFVLLQVMPTCWWCMSPSCLFTQPWWTRSAVCSDNLMLMLVDCRRLFLLCSDNPDRYRMCLMCGIHIKKRKQIFSAAMLSVCQLYTWEWSLVASRLLSLHCNCASLWRFLYGDTLVSMLNQIQIFFSALTSSYNTSWYWDMTKGFIGNILHINWLGNSHFMTHKMTHMSDE